MENKEPRIGVYICHCGSNIAGTVDVEAVTEYAQGLPSVVIARNYKYTCSDPGQEIIRQDIKELGLNRVVVASCSPQMHERTFRQVCESAGLNRYLFEMANIREHCSWVTENREAATEKAKALVSAAVRRVYYQAPLEIRKVPVNPSGGLIACGHPVGATGLMQAVFAIWQLQDTIGKHFGDSTLQVPNAQRGAIHSHAGTGTYVTVSILEKED